MRSWAVGPGAASTLGGCAGGGGGRLRLLLALSVGLTPWPHPDGQPPERVCKERGYLAYKTQLFAAGPAQPTRLRPQSMLLSSDVFS